MTQLLKAGVNINTDVGKLGPVLHIAVYEGHVTMVQMLIDTGANINSRDYHDWTPYTMALMCRRDIICSILSKFSCETSAGFAPTGLVKCTTSSEVTIYDDNKAATTGWLLIHSAITLWYTNLFTERTPMFELSSGLQVRANHPVHAKKCAFYYEVTIVNGGIERCMIYLSLTPHGLIRMIHSLVAIGLF